MVRDGMGERAQDDLLSCQADGGSGYLTALMELSKRASREAVPVGISFARPLTGPGLSPPWRRVT